jgi:hypothetical protein
MTDITESHHEKETLSIDVIIPSHDVRGNASALFEKTRKQLIERDKGCFVCGNTESLEAHHHPIERCVADNIDLKLLKKYGAIFNPYIKDFDFNSITSIYDFVDNMLVNGMLLCKTHHTFAGTGIHTLPFPLFIAQKFAKDGIVFTDKEIIHHF